MYKLKVIEENIKPISMDKFRELERIRNDYYDGNPPESGGTSIKGKGKAPGIEYLVNKGLIKDGDTILDYGAGKYARNADYLRGLGHRVYAYDPFNNNSIDAYEMEGVSNILPDETFDVVFTSFVLNVVPFHIEDDIIRESESLSDDKVFHIVRNKDVFDSIYKAFYRKSKTLMDYFYNEYGGEEGTLEEIYDLCHYGVITSRGFQRIPETEELGYTLLKDTSGFKVYGRNV